MLAQVGSSHRYASHRLVDRWQRAQGTQPSPAQFCRAPKEQHHAEDQRIADSKKLLARAAYAASIPAPQGKQPTLVLDTSAKQDRPAPQRPASYIEVQQTRVDGPIMYESVQRSCIAITRHEADDVPASCPMPAAAPAPVQPSAAHREAAMRRSAAWKADGACSALGLSTCEPAQRTVHAAPPTAQPDEWLHSIVQAALSDGVSLH